MKCKIINALFLFAYCGTAESVQIKELNIGATTAIVIYVDIKEDINLFLRDKKGNVYENFDNLNSDLKSNNKKLTFAMNAGIFSSGGIPLGLYSDNRGNKYPLNSRGGQGNFYIKPNGIFYASKDFFYIVDSSEFKDSDNLRFAIQSGPLLLNHKIINSKFNKSSTNKYTRNGVGLISNTRAVFAITKGNVNFYEFSEFFLNELNCDSAIYFDGAISSLYLPLKNINDQLKYSNQQNVKLGPIIGITQ